MTAAPVLLLHPLGSHGGFWDVVRDDLGGRQTIVPDLLGHGASPAPPAGAGLAALTDALSADLDAVGGPVDVVGVSLGGLVAQDLADRRPDAVRRLVLVDTVAVYPDAMRSMWGDRAALARSEGLGPLVGPMEEMWFSDAFRASRPEEVARARQAFLSTDPEGYARCCEVLAGADLRAAAPYLAAPTLVVCGSEDAQPFLDAARWFETTIPDARMHWISGARHAAVLEQPGPFAESVRHFLDAEVGR